MSTSQWVHSWLTGRIWRSLLSVWLISTVSGCAITSYGPEVVEPTSPSTKAGIVSFFFYTGEVKDPKTEGNSLPETFRLIQQALENKGGFAAANVSQSVSSKGLHLNIYLSEIVPSTASRIFCLLSVLTLTVLPCYSSSGGYLMRYDLLVNSEVKKSYRYEIHQRRARWIGLIPLLWMNGLTVNDRQAFRGTIYQFLRDAQADGFVSLHVAHES